MEAVKQGVYTFDIDEFKAVSPKAKDLITKMIIHPSKRLSASQVLEHPWMKEQQNLTPLPLNFGTLKNFTNHQRLKKITLTYIASQLSENEISALGKHFKSLDKNGDGVLTVEEIKSGNFE